MRLCNWTHLLLLKGKERRKVPIFRVNTCANDGARQWAGLRVNVQVACFQKGRHGFFFRNSACAIGRMSDVRRRLMAATGNGLRLGLRGRFFRPAQKAGSDDWHKEKTRGQYGHDKVGDFAVKYFCPPCAFIEMSWKRQKEFYAQNADDEKCARFEERITLQKPHKPLSHKAHGENADENSDTNEPDVVGESDGCEHVVE